VQLGERHVGGGGERRERGDEAEVAVGRTELQGHGEAEHVVLRRQRREVALELDDQRVQGRVRAPPELGPQVPGDVPAPRRQVANSGRVAVGVEGEAEHVDRRRQQRGVDVLVE
jgi:hypothetical protein